MPAQWMNFVPFLKQEATEVLISPVAWVGVWKSVRLSEEVLVNDPQNGLNITAASSMPLKETGALSVWKHKCGQVLERGEAGGRGGRRREKDQESNEVLQTGFPLAHARWGGEGRVLLIQMAAPRYKVSI